MTMFKYKLRAECMLDVMLLLPHLIDVNGGVYHFEVKTHNGFPDIIMTFESQFSLQKIKSIISKIEDSHVMLETVEHESNYTGIRKFL